METTLTILSDNKVLINNKMGIKYGKLLTNFLSCKYELAISNNSFVDSASVVIKIKSALFSYNTELAEKLFREHTFSPDVSLLLEIEILLHKKKVYSYSSFSDFDNEIINLITKIKDDGDFSKEIKLIKHVYQVERYILNEEVINAYDHLLSVENINDSYRLLVSRIKCLYFLREYDQVKQYYDLLGKDYVESGAKKYLAKAHISLGENDLGKEIFENILLSDKLYLDVYLEIFKIHYKRDFQKCERILKQVSKKFKNHNSLSEYLYCYGVHLMKQEDLIRAKEIFNRLSIEGYKRDYVTFLIARINCQLSIRGGQVLSEDVNSSISHFKLYLQRLEKKESIAKQKTFATAYHKWLKERILQVQIVYIVLFIISKRSYDAERILMQLLIDYPDRPSVLVQAGYYKMLMGDYQGAIPHFSKAYEHIDELEDLFIKKTSFFRDYGYCFYKINNLTQAEKFSLLAIDVDKSNYKAYLTLGEILMEKDDLVGAKSCLNTYLKKDPVKKYKELAELLISDIDGVGSIHRTKRGKVIFELAKKGVTFPLLKIHSDAFDNELIKGKKVIKEDIIVVLRKYNSFTPLLNKRKSKGGGYFLNINNTGLVIDPGISFLENFLSFGLSIDNIDYILISHDHNDHMADLESIISLLYKRNKIAKNKHKINLILNIGSFKKVLGFIDLKSSGMIKSIQVIGPNDEIDFGKFLLKTYRANHAELNTNNYSLSFVLKINNRSIGFTNDTGLGTRKGIISFFKREEVKLLYAHIGTIKKGDFDDENYLYDSHLGLNGLIRLIEEVGPEIVVVSEFGEELRFAREHIARSLNSVFEIPVFPGDLGLIIRITDLFVKELIPPSLINFSGEFLKMKFEDREFLDAKEIDYIETNISVLYYKKGLSVNHVINTEFEKIYLENLLF